MEKKREEKRSKKEPWYKYRWCDDYFWGNWDKVGLERLFVAMVVPFLSEPGT
jgi:hypothetical protein